MDLRRTKWKGDAGKQWFLIFVTFAAFCERAFQTSAFRRLSAFSMDHKIATFAIAETAAIGRPGTIVRSKTTEMIFSSIAPRTAFHGNVAIHIGTPIAAMKMSLITRSG
jgi:hypothetical protein